MTAEDLIAFERDVADAFNRGAIRAPIHLSGGNEEQLIAYFANHYDFARGDWVFTNWRSHYHCLLAGVPAKRLKQDILAGRSITLTYPNRRIVSSAIVGGALPIALGVALSIKRQWKTGGSWVAGDIVKLALSSRPVVHAFVGDMTARSGIFHECREYTVGHDLPITFVVEDNGKSVMTDTHTVWSERAPDTRHAERDGELVYYRPTHTAYYRYDLPWPHAGAGKRVMF